MTTSTPPSLFVFAKVSSLGPAIKKFNRDVVRYLHSEGLEFLDVYGLGALDGFAPDVMVDGKISPLALEFVRVTGLDLGDVYPDLIERLGETSGVLPLDASDDDDEESAA